jgi:hypothetical protein
MPDHNLPGPMICSKFPLNSFKYSIFSKESSFWSKFCIMKIFKIKIYKHDNNEFQSNTERTV